MPVTWVLVLLLWRYRSTSPKRKRRIGWTIFIILIVFSNEWLYKRVNLWWQPTPRAMETIAPHETAILLTGMINFDKTERGFFGSSSDRFIQANRLYHSGKVKRILITGGSGGLLHSYPSEAIFLQRMFIESGVAPQDLLVEPISRNTYENALYSKHWIDSLHLQGPFLLITSAQHMRRSEAVFKKANIAFTSFPCDYQQIDEHFVFDKHVIPNLKTMAQWTLLLKEMVGYWVYKLMGKA